MAGKPAKSTVKGRPTQRLGEDVPQQPMAPGPARRKGEPVNVVVARSEVMGGQVRMRLDAPAMVQGKAGETLLVKHVYRLQEDSPEREEYRILLRSRLGGTEHAPSLARFGDNYAMPDDYSGFLVHEYKLARGEHVLEFDVGVEYTVGSWKSTEVEAYDQRAAKGQVRVVVS